MKVIRRTLLAALPLLLSACASGEYFEYSAEGYRVDRYTGGTCSDPGTTIFLLESSGDASIDLSSQEGSALDATLFVGATGKSPVRFLSTDVEVTSLEDGKIHKLELQMIISPDGVHDSTRVMAHAQFWFNLGLDAIPELHSFTIKLPPVEVGGRVMELPIVKAVRKRETYFTGLCLR
jgi:hypothetical protein